MFIINALWYWMLEIEMYLYHMHCQPSITTPNVAKQINFILANIQYGHRIQEFKFLDTWTKALSTSHQIFWSNQKIILKSLLIEGLKKAKMYSDVKILCEPIPESWFEKKISANQITSK
jgi:hypothetical protein